MASLNPVPKLYRTVVEDVITNIREYFLDEGVDDQVLQELRQLWENKLNASKAVEPPPAQEDKVFTMYNQVKSLPQQVFHQQAQQYRMPTHISAPRPTTILNPIQHPTQPQQVLHHQTPPQQYRMPTHISAPRPTTIRNPIQHPTQVYQQQSAGPQGLALGSQGQPATMALPQGLYQQQMALQPGTIIQGQDGTQYIVQPAVPAAAASQYSMGITITETPAHGHGVHSQLIRNQQVDGACDEPPCDEGPSSPRPSGSGLQPPGPGCPPSSRRRAAKKKGARVSQADGPNDSSSDDDDFDDDKDDDDDDDKEEAEEEAQGEEEDPLNSGDDVSEDDPAEVFDTDNVVVCQYDKINRCKNRWKFHLKDGIMNLNGRDFVFQKATGDAEW